MPNYVFSAVQLPSSSGELVGGARRAYGDAGDAGNLTYGPYIALNAGHYDFEIEYASSMKGTADIGAWDVFTGARGGTTLGRGVLASTGGQVNRFRAEFDVPSTFSGERFEVRTFFNGSGWLEVRSLRIGDSAGHTPTVDFGDLRRLTPLCSEFARTRGLPVDRFYIADFLANNCADIMGHVLEVGDRQYTLRFGGHRVIKSDVLSPIYSNPDATLIADLSDARVISDNTFDCIILTQVLHIVFDFAAVMTTLRRILKPGGVALLTLPSITQAQQDYEWPFLWGFTGESARRLTEEAFGAGQAEVSVMATCCRPRPSYTAYRSTN
jgi:SAM-dependent methyltransferase